MAPEAGALANGLAILALSSVVRGLVINRFEQSGILISNTSDVIIEGNFIGTDVTGTIALPNAFDGVYLGRVTNSTIGGTSPATLTPHLRKPDWGCRVQRHLDR